MALVGFVGSVVVMSRRLMDKKKPIEDEVGGPESLDGD
jgi:hypothetical protein